MQYIAKGDRVRFSIGSDRTRTGIVSSTNGYEAVVESHGYAYVVEVQFLTHVEWTAPDVTVEDQERGL